MSILGKKAKSIRFSNKQQFYECVGYLANSGNVISFDAEVPNDHRSDLFNQHFPGQRPLLITPGFTKTGNPKKFSVQFRINFRRIQNCPRPLSSNLGKGNNSVLKRINKSKFIEDLVLNHGFKFGYSQNLQDILNLAPQQYHIDIHKGYNL